MPLTTSNINDDDYYYSEEFKTLIRSHKDFLLQNTAPTAILNRSLLFAFPTDFYVYLKNQEVPPRLWWVCAYLSGIETSWTNVTRIEKWYRPDEEYIRNIISRSNTIRM